MYSARPRFSLLESEPVKPKKALKMLSGFLASHASEPAEEGLEAAPGKLSLDEATRLSAVRDAIKAMMSGEEEAAEDVKPVAAPVAETPKQHKKKRSSGDADEKPAEEVPTTIKKKKSKAKVEAAEEAAPEAPTTQKKKKKKHSISSS